MLHSRCYEYEEEDHMNLKDAFRYQNKLQAFMQEARGILRDEDNITETKTTVFRSKADPQAEDETTVTVPESEYANQINDIVGFLLCLMTQREKLAKAIRRTKADLASERLLSGGGRGYRFNTEGNQVPYVCDLKRVTTINFDRTMVRNFCAELNRRADAVSNEVDQSLVNSNVDFIVPFDVNDSFDEAFTAYLATK